MKIRKPLPYYCIMSMAIWTTTRTQTAITTHTHTLIRTRKYGRESEKHVEPCDQQKPTQLSIGLGINVFR